MPKATKGGYYAVRKGHKPGIYLTWDECEAQVKSFPGAAYKKFATEADARAFLAGKTSAVSRSAGASHPPITTTYAGASKATQSIGVPEAEEKDVDVVYCDGACKGNGQAGSVAGVGVWWGHNDSRNLSERCPGDQTNNRAELIAIVRILETTPPLKRKLLIKTDSNYSIQCVTSWIFKWIQNGFLAADGRPVKNRGLIKYLAALLHARRTTSQTVEFEHVRGHVGIEGNEAADQLANMGTLKPPMPERGWERLEQDVLKKVPTKRKQVKGEELEAHADDGLLDNGVFAALDDTSIGDLKRSPRPPTFKSREPAKATAQPVANSSTSSRPTPPKSPPKIISRTELEQAYASCLMSNRELAQLSASGEFPSDY